MINGNTFEQNQFAAVDMSLSQHQSNGKEKSNGYNRRQNGNKNNNNHNNRDMMDLD